MCFIARVWVISFEILTANRKMSGTDSAHRANVDVLRLGQRSMTGAQRSYLKTLSEQAHQPDAYAEDLTKAEASKRIDELKRSLNLE